MVAAARCRGVVARPGRVRPARSSRDGRDRPVRHRLRLLRAAVRTAARAGGSRQGRPPARHARSCRPHRSARVPAHPRRLAGCGSRRPEAVRERVVELVGSTERLLGASVGSVIEECGVTIMPLPAVHGALPEDGYGFHRTESGEYPFLGYVIELDGVRIAHTGDTLVYDGLAERLRALDLDLLIVPINGVSWFRERRGIVGNMNVLEAAELAEASAARLVIPVHWDLFADNTEDPENFVRRLATHHPGVNASVPSIGTLIDVVPADG